PDTQDHHSQPHGSAGHPHPVPAYYLHLAPTPQDSTLSLHDALPISAALKKTIGVVFSRLSARKRAATSPPIIRGITTSNKTRSGDRKSTRLNSSHVAISYAVFCLKKKKHTYKC